MCLEGDGEGERKGEEERGWGEGGRSAGVERPTLPLIFIG